MVNLFRPDVVKATGFSNKDSNTLEIFKMVEKGNKLKLNSTRLINIEKEKLVIIKEAHVFNGNYIIENWIHQFIH